MRTRDKYVELAEAELDKSMDSWPPDSKGLHIAKAQVYATLATIAPRSETPAPEIPTTMRRHY